MASLTATCQGPSTTSVCSPQTGPTGYGSWGWRDSMLYRRKMCSNGVQRVCWGFGDWSCCVELCIIVIITTIVFWIFWVLVKELDYIGIGYEMWLRCSEDRSVIEFRISMFPLWLNETYHFIGIISGSITMRVNLQILNILSSYCIGVALDNVVLKVKSYLKRFALSARLFWKAREIFSWVLTCVDCLGTFLMLLESWKYH